MNQAKVKPQRTFTGRHMLVVILAFFATVVGVNLTMAVLATQSWTGLVVTNSYVASQNYNELLAAARRQDALGWTGSLDYDDGHLAFTLTDDAGRPVRVLDASARISRPTHERDDRTITLAAAANGYEAEATLAAGIWNVDVIARRDDAPAYRARFRLAVQKGG